MMIQCLLQYKLTKAIYQFEQFEGPGAATVSEINNTTIWKYRDESVILKNRKTGYE